MSLLLTLNTFHSFFNCFYCWLWTGKCFLGNNFSCFICSHWRMFWKLGVREILKNNSKFLVTKNWILSQVFFSDFAKISQTSFLQNTCQCLLLDLYTAFLLLLILLWWHRHLFLLCSIALFFSALQTLSLVIISKIDTKFYSVAI